MPINVFGNPSNNSDNKIDSSLFVQKPCLRTKYIEGIIEEDIDLKNQFRIKNLADPISVGQAASKNYVYNKFHNGSINTNTEHIDLNDRSNTNARFIQVKQWIQMDSHLTAKFYVDNAIDEPSLVRRNHDKDFNKNNLTNINSITLNTQAVNDSHVITKANVDQFHIDKERNIGDCGLDFYNESNDLVKNNQDKDLNDNNLRNVNSFTINRISISDNEVSTKDYIDDELDKNTILKFSQTLEN